MGENWLVVFITKRGAHDPRSNSINAFESPMAPCSCVVLAPKLLSSGALALGAFAIINTSPCCTVASKPWFLFHRIAFEPLFNICRDAVVTTLVTTFVVHCIRPPGVRCIGAFVSGDMLLERDFLLFLDFVILGN